MSATDPDQLLAHAGWLRALALRLTRDRDVAEDLVQETYVASLEHPPHEPSKSWLAKVLLNTLRMRARGEARRSAREHATLLAAEDVPTPDVLVARAQAQRTLVDLVLRLDEPYRTTLLLHYCEGVSLADIARTQSVPAGTVRWRLKTALDQLRAWLEEEPERKRWVVLLAVPKGALVANKVSKVVAVVVLLILLLVAGIAIKRSRSDDDTTQAAATGSDRTGGPTALRANSTDPGASDAELPRWLIQTGVKPRRIAGRVMFRGAPVEGATVELASIASESGIVSAPRRVTGAGGEFDFGAQPALEWNVRASAPQKSAAALDIDTRDPTARADAIELELGACEAAMFGTVRDASGGPIAKARLARLSIGSAGASAPTGRFSVPGGPAVIADDKGAYELCVEPRWPGWVSVEVSAVGYGSIVIATVVRGRVKTDLALVPEATIVGRVVRDDTGEPVPNANVFAPGGNRRELETTAWRGTFTDAAGRFKLDRVAPGRHLVMARAEGMVDVSRGTQVVVAAGQTTPEIEIRLEAGSRITGIVQDHGKPVAGARVTATDGLRASRMAISQSDGSFALDEVPRGELHFIAHPYDVISPKTFRASEPAHDHVVLEVEALAAITGRVVRRNAPVGGASLYIRGPNDRELEPVRADANGRFEARGLRPGPWSLSASSERDGAFGNAAETITLKRGETKDVTIELAYSASIAGRVVDQDGMPVGGVSVEFVMTTTDDGGYSTTASDGSFRATTMTGGGQYRPTVRRDQLSKGQLKPARGSEFPLIALPGPTSEVTGVVLAVQLDRLAIAGKVVDTSGAPVPDARVVVQPMDAGDSQQFFRGLQDPATTTDVDGAFSIGDLSAGTYAVFARSTAGETTVANVRAGRTDLTITIAASGALEGTLAGFTSAPQVTATAIVSGPPSPTVATVTGTTFSIRQLPPGNYTVIASTAREAASATVEVIAGRTARVTLTSHGSGAIAGRVREFRSGKPVEGMTCRAVPQGLGAFSPGSVTRSDASGAFSLPAAPAGDVVVYCNGLSYLYSDGRRSVTLSTGGRIEVDIPVVAWNDPALRTIASFGADIDDGNRLVFVHPAGPAAAAGLQNGDVVSAVDGAAVDQLSPQGVWVLISNRAPGTTVKLTVTRAGKRITADVVMRPT